MKQNHSRSYNPETAARLFELTSQQYQVLVRLAKGQNVKRNPVLKQLIERHFVRIGIQPFPILTHVGETVVTLGEFGKVGE